MVLWGRLCSGVLAGFVLAPVLSSTTAAAAAAAAVVWCDGAPTRSTPGVGAAAHISADGQTNHLFDNDAMPTAEELQYVKTWGVRWVDDWDRPTLRAQGGGMRSLWSGSSNKKSSSSGSNSKGKRQILMIRHGQYENESARDDRVRQLTPLGVRQSRMTGAYLRDAFAQTAKQREAHEAWRQARRALRHAEEKDEQDSMNNNNNSNSNNNSNNDSDSSDLVALASSASTRALARLREAARAAELRERAQGGFVVADAPHALYVSDMTRAKQTLDGVLESFPRALRKCVVVDPDLRERFPCDPQPPYRRHNATAADMKVAEDVFERYFYRPTSDESTVDVIVGHGNVIRYLTLRALQLPPEAWLRTTLPHCSITSVTIGGDGHVKLVGWGSYGHLPPDMTTTHNVS